MRLIDADELLKKKVLVYSYFNDEAEGVLVEDIEDAPTINLEDLRPKGKWVYDIENDSWHCSVCEEENCYAYDENLKRFTDRFCPNCGAKME